MRDSGQHINLCVNCGYRPCRCPFWADDDVYEIAYDEPYLIDENLEDY